MDTLPKEFKLNHRNFRGRKWFSQTSKFNTLGLTDDGMKPNPHGDLEAGPVVGSGVEM